MISEKTYALMSAVAYLDELAIGSTLQQGIVEQNDAIKKEAEKDRVEPELIQVSDASVDGDWALMDTIEEGSWGLQLQTWKNDVTCEVVVAFRGTESILDLINDGVFAFGGVSLQQQWAEEYFSTLTAMMGENEISDYTISSTGHSLGGFLADWFADCAYRNYGAEIPVYAFNPPMPPLSEEELHDNDHVIVFSDPFFWGNKARLVHDGLTTNFDAEYRISVGAENHGIVSLVNALESAGPSITTDDYLAIYVEKMKSGTIEGNDYYAASEFLMAIKDNWEQRVPGTLAVIQAAMEGHVYEVTLDGQYEADGIVEAFTVVNDELMHSVDAGSKDDLIKIDDGQATFVGGTGRDTVSFAGASSAITSSQTSAESEITFNRGGFGGYVSRAYETEEVVGSNHADTFVFESALTIRAGGGNDTVIGGDLNDTIHGDAGVDSLVGGDGNDEIHGGAENDTIIGGDGNDTLYGDGGSDFFEGGAGNDVIVGGDDAEDSEDQLSYAGIIDTIEHMTKNYGIVSDGNIVRHSVSGIEFTDIIDEIETLVATKEADFLLGLDVSTIEAGNGDDFIRLIGGDTYSNSGTSVFGEAGDDTIISGLGDDYVDGGTGSDRFYSGAGVDKFFGGEGYDWYDFSLATEAVRIDISSHDNKAIENDGFGYTEFIWNGMEIEAIQGSSHADLMILTVSTVHEVHLGGGNDTIMGSREADKIYGDDGDDILRGGEGNDSLWGGSGSDIFEFAASGLDVIRDFQGAGADDGDRIYVSGWSNITFGTGRGQVSFYDLSNGMTQMRFNEDYDTTFERIMLLDDGDVLASAYTVDDFVFSI